MNLIRDFESYDACSYFNDELDEDISNKIENGECDEDLINENLEERYPKFRYFVLVDYIDENNGYFHIRVWEK